MHTSSLRRMEWFVNQYIGLTTCRLRVLDVGSFDVNGSYKQFFDPEKFDYVGLDMEAGPNVDIIPTCIYNWREIPDDSFDVVISGQALEHIEFFWVSTAEMTRVLKRDGLLCIIAPSGANEHRYPVDCWRFFTDGMIAIARYFSLDLVHAHTNRAPTTRHHDWLEKDSGDAMLIARKPYSGKPIIINLDHYACVPANHNEISNGLISPGRNIIYRIYHKIGRIIGAL